MGDEDKQFDATPRKLEQARKEGQVVKSKDFSTAVSLLILFSVIFGLAPFIWNQIVQVFTLLYEQIPNTHTEQIGYMYILTIAIKGAALIIGPILAIAWLVAVLADFVQVGPLVAIAPLMPKLDKLNPTKYFKNIMSIKTLFELFKNIVKVLILGYIGWAVYKDHIESILMLASVDNNFAVMIEFGKLITEFIFKACIAFLIIAAADYGVTKWKFLKDQKMSFKEIKDEYKNSEGDPNVKAALRQRRMQMLQQGAMDAVPTADFVVTNPTHVACALKYVAEEMDSPMLIAKGTELIAKKIIGIAKEHNVPVIENPPVARALFKMVDINQPIPPELYKAVAEILMFVYKMKRKNTPNKRPRN
ncbi:TPA: flagellar biosynthesis protein FlhB [Candidatus Gastranaerophilales bacterium HUM_6]|jgi:flagellar biosynthetic protein flhB|nr:EscU/YscU/HrcU family type III secretion system export apparatus switch protein [bacterium]CDE93119.1 flagellar biosynthetic protein FlhB [Fusobacterium sp. CAG:815]DAA93157.1 MAG TPA: flagellar biosynthesis protein FlhB [Candidatus Gastranaerophilales bacterium HUM_6]DAA93577.1 MAG TPA: flagellar biosynthesis protein FlhB [Candidatus Gastranaerophilales bacterium HUM_7]DAB01891.1 MAG TPA: flagellar biosynthesis protein FlhB [Candidatus Gastranaerophilales bacterium HUM_12]DAB06492.1 MAG TP